MDDELDELLHTDILVDFSLVSEFFPFFLCFILFVSLNYILVFNFHLIFHH